MSLATVVDAVATRLRGSLPASATVGDIAPATPADLPTITITIVDAEQDLAGLGRVPRAARTGALSLDVVIDLADPVLTIGPDSIELLSPDRHRLVVPNGPIVRADGTDGPPFAAADIQIADPGDPYTIVNTPTPGRTALVDAVAGEVTFGQVLPPTGELTVTYHIGRWDVTVIRHRGSLTLTTSAATAQAASDLSRQVAAELDRRPPDFDVLHPTAWSSTGPLAFATDPVATGHLHTLSYRFVFELETPSLPPAGGAIRTVAVDGTVEDTTESFEIPINP